jgi:hypothetical protein
MVGYDDVDGHVRWAHMHAAIAHLGRWLQSIWEIRLWLHISSVCGIVIMIRNTTEVDLYGCSCRVLTMTRQNKRKIKKYVDTRCVSSCEVSLLLWICIGVRPVFCNRACCCSFTDDPNWLKSVCDAKDRLLLVQSCLCTSWSCSRLLLVASRCQLLLCSRQIVAVLRAAVCLYAAALDFVTLTKLYVTWWDAQGWVRALCALNGCVCYCYALPMRLCCDTTGLSCGWDLWSMRRCCIMLGSLWHLIHFSVDV